MAKKLTTILFIILCLGGLYGGVYVYRALQDTPERTVQRFTQELSAGETDRAYTRLSTDLVRGRESYWRDYIKQFKQDDGEPRLVSHEQLKDTFNTYPQHSSPERFTYALKRAGQDYQLTIITIKIDKTWVIAELYGG